MRYPNPHLIKIHRSYTVEEAALRLGKHKNTVRNWIDQGLPVISEKRPTLIMGAVLRQFLVAKRAAGKRPCKLGEFYCFRCRGPRTPFGNMADFVPINTTLGTLSALCSNCNTPMHQHANIAKIQHLRAILDITTPQAQRHIGE